MKRNWPYYIIAFCLALLTVYVLHNSGRIFPSGEVGEVYRRYCNRDDIRVEFFKDFRIDDSTIVDVTTLIAKDSASWEALQREMNRSEEAIERSRNRIKEGHYVLTDYYCEIGHPEHRIPFKEGECWLVYVNHKEKTFYIFHIINHEQGYLIIRSKTRELYNNRKK
ncbi:MAG: hypothetical protein IKQ53_08100, partial [Bacteroidales bacterium]|nr:hypothetical protein [Bacteroidales bacterium]